MASAGMELRKGTVMGKFDGYLICSDFDGTFAVTGEPVQRSLEAVRYFTQNGGRFTVATGRMIRFMEQRGVVAYINAPACLCNGSIVYDYAENKLLCASYVSMTVREICEAVASASASVKSYLIYPNPEIDWVLEEDWHNFPEAYLECKPLKMLFKFETEEQANAFEATAKENPALKEIYISKSWRFGVEFNPADGTKGKALEYIRNHLGDIRTTVGVGDYENDMTLLASADIAATPEGGLEVLKAMADMILCPCADGAIADLIEKLEASL